MLKRSRVGAIFVNKDAGGGSARFNRTMGVDANLALGPSVQVSSFLAKTATPGLSGNDLSYYGRVAYRDPAWNLWLNYLNVQDNFNDEVGFVQRTGVKTTKAYISRTPRPGKWNIRVMDPMFVFTYITDQHNRMIGRTTHFMSSETFDDGSYVNVIYQKNLDVLDKPFQIQPGVKIPVGTYKFDELNLSYNTNPSKKFYGRVTFTPMGFYGGTRRNLNTSVGVRATSALSTELQFSRNDVNLPYGAFLVNLGILRVDYAFSPKATIRTLTQYNSSTHEFSSSVRFNLIYRPGSDVYIVYNDLQQTNLPQNAFKPTDRQLVVKMTYMLAR